MRLLTWYRDQELRFTVHDSPDYYQLKVSVFNDDKKTDLIGETWVSLEDLVVPGGGQNELWHNLNCKGKYAGDIRIELTYYDTRPREEKPAERRRDSARNGLDETGRESLSGPRLPKALKRRPLPADPTDSSPLRPTMPTHSQSSPLSFTPPLQQQPPQYSRAPQISHHRYPQNGYVHDPLAGGTQSYHFPAQGNIAMAPSPQCMESALPEIYDPGETDYIPGNILGRYDSFENEEEEFRQPQHLQATEYREVSPISLLPRQSLPQQPRHRGQPPSLPHSNSSPLLANYHKIPGDGRSHVDQSHDHGFYGSSPLHSYQASPTPLASSHTSYGYEPRSMQPSVEDDEPPPPPPAHRSSGSQLAQYESPTQNRYQPGSAPAPLNIRSSRNSASPTPYGVQGMEPYPQDEYRFTPSPSSGRGLSRPGASGYSDAQRAHYAQPQRRQSQDPAMMSRPGEGSYVMPPSLVAGYNPRSVGDQPSFPHPEQRMNPRVGNGPGFAPMHQHSASYETQLGGHSNSLPDVAMPKAPAARGGNQAHRSSAPIIKPQAVSPATRTPIRKSVSPQPGPRPRETRPSSVPFSPDSYDAFNPNIASAVSVKPPGAQYSSPELAKQASRQALRETSREEEPIIGDDGRIIDPSDHLPTETWAPEPDRKNARKAPEPTTRSRPSPQGAQPMPPAGRRPLRDGAARPHSITTPIYAHSPDTVSPSSPSRNRLQKRLLVTPTQPSSSPAVPTLHSMPRSLPRTSTADYPLREHENYGYAGGSPHPARGSPNGPPPIPAKLPIVAGQEDYDTLSLSEEMRRIDIGVGAGSGRTRRRGF